MAHLTPLGAPSTGVHGPGATGRAALRGAATLLILFLAVAALMRIGATRGIDRALLGWDRVTGAHHPFGGSPALLHGLMLTTDLGGTFVRTLVTLAGVATLVMARRRSDAILLGGAVAGGAIASEALKWLVGRPRPDPAWWLIVERHASFPSGHAMGSMILYPLIGLMIGRAARRGPWWIGIGIGIALALIIGATRVLLGVHWASDVVGGWLIGGAWTLAAIGLGARSRAGRARAGGIRAGGPPAP